MTKKEKDILFCLGKEIQCLACVLCEVINKYEYPNRWRWAHESYRNAKALCVEILCLPEDDD